MVDLSEHAVYGNWAKLTQGILSDRSASARVMIPVAVSGDYEIRMAFTRRTGAHTVGLLLPVYGNQCGVFVDGWYGTHSGIAAIGDSDLPHLAGTPAAKRNSKTDITNGVRSELKAIVRGNASQVTIRATLNGADLAAWTGDPAKLNVWGSNSLPCLLAPGIVTWGADVDVHELVIVLLDDAKGYRLQSSWKCPLFDLASNPPAEIAGQTSRYDGRHYYISPTPLRLPLAQRLAFRLKGRLLTVSSQEEESQVASLAQGRPLWMAGWRPANGDSQWRDDFNSRLTYLPNLSAGGLAIDKVTGQQLGLFPHNREAESRAVSSSEDSLHACIEWGAEN
jgi:hypothetical protein